MREALFFWDQGVRRVSKLLRLPIVEGPVYFRAPAVDGQPIVIDMNNHP
jgi:hypothetical protein